MALTRWHVLAASFIAIFTGQPGPWGVYSDTIKTRFDLTQSQLDTVAYLLLDRSALPRRRMFP